LKYDTYSQYDPRGVALTERALLTVWAGLGAWHDELVLIGGLVPRYLCGDIRQTRTLPHPVTLDADLGIALGATRGQYGSLRVDLRAQGFELTTDEDGAPRFVKQVGEFTAKVDFLAEHSPATEGSVVVDDVPASILPGVNRALATARIVTVEGVDLHGASQKLAVRVCEAGAFLMLKLRAFGSRQQPKDAFDILYTLRHYDRGTPEAIKAFAEEARAGNPAFPDAARCVEQHFTAENSPAPVKAAHFVCGQSTPNETGDIHFRRLQIQQDMVDAGRLLKAALASAEPPTV